MCLFVILESATILLHNTYRWGNYWKQAVDLWAEVVAAFVNRAPVLRAADPTKSITVDHLETVEEETQAPGTQIELRMGGRHLTMEEVNLAQL